jgi:hypothetical protein
MKTIEVVSKPNCHPEGGSATEGSTLPTARFFATLRFAQNDMGCALFRMTKLSTLHSSPRNMQKSLDTKLTRIAADPSCGDFILADAKDADMAFGISAFGRVAESLRDSDLRE